MERCQKVLWPDPGGRPMTAKKTFPEKSFPATVTFRPDQFPIVRKLQDARKLSEVCQKAVDEEAKR